MWQQAINGVFLGAIYALFAVGYALVFGVLDILNLAHQAVFTLSAFIALAFVAEGNVPLAIALPVSLLAAGLIGIGLGTIIGQSVWAMRGLDPIFQILRTISPLAWLPISLAAFRDSQPSAIFVIFITSVWPIIINTAVGIRNIPQDYRNVAAVLRLNHLEFFWKIMIPSAAPYIFTGLRIGIGLSWLAIVAAEMLTGGVGIGFFIWDAWNSSRLSDIVVALVYIGLVGFVLDRLVAAVATFVTRGTSAN